MSAQIQPQQLQTYHIFLASPGDMDEERQTVRKFFQDYNRNIANRNGLEFKLVDWEHYANSGLGRAQALITRQTLGEYRNSLVLVIGLLGQRFGTPTGAYQSGTEEEFATALSFRQEQGDWPEIKWFFRQGWDGQGMPKDPEKMLEAGAQWRKVLDFKHQLQTGDQQFLTVDFPTNQEFAAIFRHDMQRWLHESARPWNIAPTATAIPADSVPSPETSPYLTIWLKLLGNDCARLPLEILDSRQGLEQCDPIALSDIFVPLKAMPPSDRWKRGDAQDLALAREMAAGSGAKPVPVLEILAQQRLAVVIGNPGSGKSALVNQLAWMLSPNGQPAALPDCLQGRTPVRIVLRRVEIPENAKIGQAAWLWQALEAEIGEALQNNQQAGRQASAVLASLQQKLLQAPGGLMLLDGLDEVPAANRRRSLLLQAITALAEAMPEHTRFIVTARPYAYTDPGWQLKQFTPFFLTPFDQEQTAQFIHGWYAAARSRFSLRDSDLRQRIPDLIDQVENRPHLRELARRPLLLTLISTLHAGGGRLPDDRARLYQDSVDLLLYRWRREAITDSSGHTLRLEESELLPCLQDLAYSAHLAQQQQGDAEHTADISEDALFKAFKPLLKKLGQDDLLAFLQQHTGILIARDQQSFAFPHRSFQEYLAMGWLTGQSAYLLSPLVCADPFWWREVFLLAVIELKTKPLFAASYVRDILKCGQTATADNGQRLAILGGLALLELNQKDPDDLNREVVGQLLALLADATALNPAERAEAGRVLAGLGDPRSGVGLNAQGWPAIDWVKIPAGKISLDENAGAFPVEAFYLARHPVTNRQFQSFIEDPQGYANPVWWAGLDAAPETPSDPGWSEANHPRETVSWFEAMAFCAWLSARLGYSITLPAEWQWQQAACSGRASFNYPWGKDYRSGFANINETWGTDGPHDLGRTSAVGIYPQGDSEQGGSDLSGNVWEWCLNGYDKPADTQPGGTFSRVVRGGSWVLSQGSACASYRNFCPPDSRCSPLGFRVCCVSPI